jgi:hypothetical protein
MKQLMIAVVALSLCAAVSNGQNAPGQTFSVTQSFPLGGDGTWDYATLNADGSRLFVTRASHTMVIDTASGKLVADITGNTLSHGVALVPSVGRGFISNGRGGYVTIFDLKTYAVLGNVKTDLDSDGIIYDPASDRVMVVCGDPGLMFAIKPDIDPTNGVVDPPLKFGGKPEFLASDNNGRVFVNLTDKNEIAVVDSKTMTITARWPTAPGTAPTGLSIDRQRHRLFCGCRGGKVMVILSTDDGHVISSIPIGTTVDATAFYKGMGFASCADGTLTIAVETAPDHFDLVQVVQTAPGARTMALDPNTGKIYLPTAQLTTPATSPAQPRARATPVPGSFRVLVVER